MVLPITKGVRANQTVFLVGFSGGSLALHERGEPSKGGLPYSKRTVCEVHWFDTSGHSRLGGARTGGRASTVERLSHDDLGAIAIATQLGSCGWIAYFDSSECCAH